MSEWVGANWIWLLLGVGVVWFLFRRGGMGCGTGGHAHGSGPADKREIDEHAGPAAQGGATHEHGGSASRPRRHGCC
jgi:hypothetical protein